MRVLICEDETIIRLDLRAICERAGLEVVGEASDGEEALRLAASSSPTWSSWTCRCRSSTGSRRPAACSPNAACRS